MKWLKKFACCLWGHKWALDENFRYKLISIKKGSKARWYCCRCKEGDVSYFPPICSWDRRWLTNMKDDFAHYHLMRKMFRKQMMYQALKKEKKEEKYKKLEKG